MAKLTSLFYTRICANSHVASDFMHVKRGWLHVFSFFHFYQIISGFISFLILGGFEHVLATNATDWPMKHVFHIVTF